MKSVHLLSENGSVYNQTAMSLVRTGDIKVISGSACASSVEMAMFEKSCCGR